jgi:hypothetical protein
MVDNKGTKCHLIFSSIDAFEQRGVAFLTDNKKHPSLIHEVKAGAYPKNIALGFEILPVANNQMSYTSYKVL